MRKFLVLGLLLMTMVIFGCGSNGGGGHGGNPIPPVAPEPEPEVIVFPVATAVVSINSYGDLAMMKKKPNKLFNLIVPMAHAQVQSSGVVSVTYTNPGATAFTLNTSAFMAGSYPQVVGDDLQMGNIAVASLDDNSLRVCTGVGAPQNRCNRLYIRVFTLGSNVANTITGIPGFINTDGSYGIDVRAGTVATPIGWNASQTAASVTNAATVHTYTIASSMNRVRLTDTGAISFPIKADLSNAGAGNYEMRLVIQYALGYVP